MEGGGNDKSANRDFLNAGGGFAYFSCLDDPSAGRKPRPRSATKSGPTSRMPPTAEESYVVDNNGDYTKRFDQLEDQGLERDASRAVSSWLGSPIVHIA